ncbi:MAG: phosphotransferase [Acidimicrobiia bacterium]|nr:phosphotransferase [Acidimicrobiia bacterium]
MDLEKIGTGRLGDVFAWEDGLALKLYRSPERNSSAEREAEATMAVVAAGVPAARCHGTVVVDGRVGLILDRLPGPLMADIVFDDGERAMVGLAELQCRIHERTAAGFVSMKEALEARIINAVPSGVREMVLQRLRELPDGDSILHSDLHVLNVMLGSEGTWVAIDWDRAITGPHHYGVARSLFLITEADLGDLEPVPGITEGRRELGEIYLREYSEHRSLDRHELAAWRLPVLAARLDEPIAAERDYLLGEIERELSRA